MRSPAQSPLMKSVSGIRGIVGETVTPDLCAAVGNAFARYCKGGTVVLGRDSRNTGAAISGIVESALVLTGCMVVDCGIVPTPTVQVVVEELGAAGGIVISASHNPVEWNAFKLVGPLGSFLTAPEIDRFFRLMDDEPDYRKWNRIGSSMKMEDADDIHIGRVMNVVDGDIIKKRKLLVALDSVNGAGSRITPVLLERLGCRVIPVHCELTGSFPRGAEPLPENLKDLCRAVVGNGADIGFAQDPDADRLAIVDEKGVPLGEEYTITLVAEHLLSHTAGDVVVNLSTTKAVEDIAVKHGAAFARTRVGEIHVVEEIRKRKARIGGEGNGGVISPEVHLGRDSLAGIGYVLEMMAERKSSISELKSSLPLYYMKKGRVPAGSIDEKKAFRGLKAAFRGEMMSDSDGLRIDFSKHEDFRGGWVHLRGSNTEPVFRIIAEGISKKQVSRIYSYFSSIF